MSGLRPINNSMLPPSSPPMSLRGVSTGIAHQSLQIPVMHRVKAWFREQTGLIRGFYHLNYWRDHTLSQGFAEAMDGVSEMVQTGIHDQAPVVQAVAGAGLGVARLVGGIPIALNEWAIQVTDEIPNGPGATFYKLVEVPVSGIVHGAFYVGSSFKDWFRGSLNNRDSFFIAQEVTTVLGSAALMIFGARNIGRGAGKFLDGMQSSFFGSFSFSPGLGYAVAAVGSEGVIALAGGADLLGGSIMMMSSEPNGKEPTEGSAKQLDSSAAHSPLSELIQKYGGALFERSADVKGPSKTVSFRLPESEKGILENISQAHGLSLTAMMRIALEYLKDTVQRPRELLERYGGDLLVESKTPGAKTTTLSFRFPQEEVASINTFSQAHQLSRTITIRLAIRFLRDAIEGKIKVTRSSTPARFDNATLLTNKVADIVSTRISEGITHIQNLGNDTFLVVTESGSVIEVTVSFRPIRSEP